MNFGEVFSRSWKLIWKYKVLWIFGILAGLASGGGGGGGGGSNNSYQYNNNGNPNFDLPNNIPWYQVERWFETNWWIFIILAVLFLLFIVACIILGTFGRIGLARGAWQADEGAEKLSFGKLFGESGAYFWRILGLTILIAVMWIAFFLVITLPALGFTVLTAGIGALCLVPFFLVLCCVLIPLGWAVTFITEQAIVAVTCDNIGVFDALKKGWDLLRANLGAATVMVLVLGIGSGIVRFLLALPALLIIVPLIPAFINGSEQALMTGGIVSLVLFCLYIPFSLIFNGVVTAYTGTAWVLTYRQLTRKPEQPVVVEAAPLP